MIDLGPFALCHRYQRPMFDLSMRSHLPGRHGAGRGARAPPVQRRGEQGACLPRAVLVTLAAYERRLPDMPPRRASNAAKGAAATLRVESPMLARLLGTH